MTLAAILTALEDYLAPLITDTRGKLVIAETELDAHEELALNAGNYNVTLCPVGGESAEDMDQGGYVADSIALFLQVPRVMTPGANKGLHRTGAGRPMNFMARLAWLQKQVRGFVVESAQIDDGCARVLRFKDWDWVRVDGQPATIRAARLRFEVRYVLDAPDGAVTTLVPNAGGIRLQIVGAYLHVTALDGVTVKRVRLLDLP
jgi:hypothetical protein